MSAVVLEGSLEVDNMLVRLRFLKSEAMPCVWKFFPSNLCQFWSSKNAQKTPEILRSMKGNIFHLEYELFDY